MAEKGSHGGGIMKRGGFFRYACAIACMVWRKSTWRRQEACLRILCIGVGWVVVAGFKGCSGLIYSSVVGGKGCF